MFFDGISERRFKPKCNHGFRHIGPHGKCMNARHTMYQRYEGIAQTVRTEVKVLRLRS